MTHKWEALLLKNFLSVSSMYSDRKFAKILQHYFRYFSYFPSSLYFCRWRCSPMYEINRWKTTETRRLSLIIYTNNLHL